ncbi:hypothetical protein L2X99_06960 [Microbacterium sp. KUDC0406]|uniref:hypothetical protein n=1 Tax=Microbacterium sp. KUDC0406 TaxID=2909588 RepID=UPI001F45DE9D|nr:hypothetical protein [Microbacterium sp. KUDC0406]UJP11265.1 hypothetical protein L2X99_06960 [Microbacterium sp. KUDC0406]
MTPRIPVAAIGILALALAITACAPSPEPAPTKTTAEKPPVEAPPATAAAEDPDPAPAEGADPTCDTIISEGTVEALKEQGWSAEASEFRVGELVLDGGLMCSWADYSTASDHGQQYGWAPVDAKTASDLQATLLSEGWQRVEGEDGVITEDPRYAFATDDEGYGVTYQFGDGWVEIADTKQGLLLIDWK